MTDSPRGKVHALRHMAPPPSLPSPSSPIAQALSPLVQLLPTGYRDIQPFQKGKGWHTNGPDKSKQSSRFRRPRDVIAAENGGASNGEKVVFPVIPTYEGKRLITEQSAAAAGPRSNVVEYSDGDERLESEASFRHDEDESKPAPRAISSPSIASTPVPPSTPRRPSHGETNQASGPSPSASSFRTRAIAAAAGNSNNVPSRPSSSDPLSPTQQATASGIESEIAISSPSQVPDPELVAKLWQEYAERTKSKAVDKEAYHRKMQHKYNELKVMRERITRLESELLETQRERDEARDAASRSVQQNIVSRWKDSDSSEEIGSEARSGAQQQQHQQQQQQQASSPTSHHQSATRKSVLKVLQTLNPEEVSYREKCFKLERALATTKVAMSETQTTLREQHEKDRDIINALQAKLLLEQETSQVLSKQLHEATIAFKATADELVATQIELEKEQIHKKIVMEQIQQQTSQLVTDHRHKELQNRVRNVIRNLGKEALHQKMEALHTRVLVAEQSMRRAQLQVTNLKAERDAQQQQLEQILSSSALKYHSLACDGGVPGILQRGTQLYYGSRVVNDQVLMLQILYEDERAPLQTAHSRSQQESLQMDACGNELFRMHFVCYEPFTAQDDFLTFQLRDIKRLVPDPENFLACYADRKRERLQELAEILFTYVHAGYKNGHLVITEIPTSTTSAVQSLGGSGYEGNDQRREVTIYRATQFMNLQGTAGGSECVVVLVELVVNEVCAASTSQLWWLEIRALVLESDGLVDSEQSELVTKVDSHQLRSLCSYFGSYRPSESMVVTSRSGFSEFGAENELSSIHEELLEPVLSKLKLVSGGSSGRDGVEEPSGAMGTHGRVQLVLDLPTGNEAISFEDKISGGLDSSSHSEAALSHGNEEIVSSAAAVQDDTSESVLDHRCIVNISDVFYCVRIQEIWDAELMLEIVMEDPETLSKFHRIIRESELIELAGFLFALGLVDENCASQVTNGLPRKLHTPVCKLLKKHMQPVVEVTGDSTAADEDQGSSGDSGEISIASLTEEMSSKTTPKTEGGTSQTWPTSNSVGRWSTLEPLENDLSSEFVENVAAQLADQSSLVEQRYHKIKRTRRGFRSLQSSNGAQYVVVDIWSGFQGFEGFVLEVFPVSGCATINSNTDDDERERTSTRVVTSKPLDQALEALGLAASPALMD
ncbi:hypothetical protein Gpo141_00011693 [Globisporangium polare]